MPEKTQKKPFLFNIMEDEVRYVLQSILSDPSVNVCRCEKCFLKIIAIALNNLPPLYVVSEEERVINKVVEIKLQDLARMEVEVMKAIEIVKNNPGHT